MDMPTPVASTNAYVTTTNAESQRELLQPVYFAGALPPPVTGMTAMTAIVVEELRRRGMVVVDDWSPGRPLTGWRWKLRRGYGALRTCGRLLLRGRGRGARFYYALSSDGGLYYDVAILVLARFCGYRLVLHHHAYSYFDQFYWRVKLIDRLAGPQGAHVVHCEQMKSDFLRTYPGSRCEFWFVPPTVASPLQPVDAPRSARPATLGFLSNLTFAKGLAEAVAVFESLAEEDDVRLVLAGPCMGSAEQRFVERTLAAWPGRAEYRGPVYGEAKCQFFSEIDLFLFPTKYRNESWGIVLTEALAFGRPVLAWARGCVSWIVQAGCGQVIERNADFVAAATEQIRSWRERPETFAAAQTAARERIARLQDDARRELPELIERLTAPASPA